MRIPLPISIVGLILLSLVALALLPIAFIYSLNILFSLSIPLGIKTWGAAAFLLLLLIGLRSK